MTSATDTDCPYCSLQCGVTLRVAPGEVLELTGRDFPTNRGGLCLKGANAGELIGHRERLTTPLAGHSRDGPLRPVSRDDALDRVAAAITAAQRDHDRDAVGCFGGGGLTNEKAYQFGKFARVALRSAMIDYNGRVLHVLGRRGCDQGVRPCSQTPGAVAGPLRSRTSSAACEATPGL